MKNYVCLIGNAGSDAVHKIVANEQDFASVSLATSETYKDKNSGDRVKLTEWHNIIAWRNVAKSLARVKKGKLIEITGKIKTRKYTDKDGQEKWITEIIADSVLYLEKMGESTGNQETHSDIADQTDISKIKME